MCDLGNQNKFAICPILIGSQCATKDAIYLVICVPNHIYGKPNVAYMHVLWSTEEQRINLFLIQKNAIGQHYLTEHLGKQAMLSYRLLDIESISVRRKIVEALKIQKLKLN